MAEELKSWDGRRLDWRNKATDRFLLRWIKRYLSAPLSLLLRRIPGIRPWMATTAAAALGLAAGATFALGYAWPAGLLAAAGQILDGVDGQLARLRGTSSPRGAYLDSVLDRLADGALLLGMVAYLLRHPLAVPHYYALVAVLGAAAFLASNLVSYSGARAGELGLPLPPKPTLASKGTRTTAMVAAALATPLWPGAPAAALLYLALHPSAAVGYRLLRALKGPAR